MSDRPHLGIIRVSDKLLLDWLQFEGGEIRSARMQFFGYGGVLELVISHPDMPDSPMPDAAFSVINPIYTEERDSEGHLIAVRRGKDGG